MIENEDLVGILMKPSDSGEDQPISTDDPAAYLNLVEAIRVGDLSTCISLLRQNPSLALVSGKDGAAPLHLAAEHDDARIAAVLVAAGADLHARHGQSAHTPLSWAVTCNAMECARALVHLGAKADLFCAAGMGDLPRAQSFFEQEGKLVAGASQTGSSRYDLNGALLPCPPIEAGEILSDALYIACRNGHVSTVEFLLTKSPDLSFRAYMGATPYHWAYFGGSNEIIKALQKAGASEESRDERLGCTPRAFGIFTPISWGFTFLVQKQLARDPSLVNLIDQQNTPLHLAIRGHHEEIVQLLIQYGAAPSIRPENGISSIELARELGNPQIVAHLETIGDECNRADPRSS